MEKIKFKTKIMLSCIIGIIAGIITFPIVWDSHYGNTPEEIKQVETAIEKLFQKRDEIDFVPDWSEVEKIIAPLVFENKQIAKAKALTHYSEYPKDRFGMLEDIKISNDIWIERYKISQEDWKIQTKLSKSLTSTGSSILSGIGTALTIFLILTILPILVFVFVPHCWCFLLKRIGELSRAI